MRFGKKEYTISEDGKSITISKKAIEQWAEHYHDIAYEYHNDIQLAKFYFGKEDALIEILRHFDY